MAGTNAQLVVHDVQQVDGYNLTLPVSGGITLAFPNRVSSVSIHNTTGDYVRFVVTTVLGGNGNQRVYIAPYSAVTFGDYPLAAISQLDIQNEGITGNGGGIILVNGYYY
jgi:hypothetical protein